MAGKTEAKIRAKVSQTEEPEEPQEAKGDKEGLLSQWVKKILHRIV